MIIIIYILYFPLRAYQKSFFFFYIMYFVLYNPNLKSVFCGRTYKYVFLIKYPEWYNNNY